jgi:hypothetical protein
MALARCPRKSCTQIGTGSPVVSDKDIDALFFETASIFSPGEGTVEEPPRTAGFAAVEEPVTVPPAFCRIKTAALSYRYGVPDTMSKVNAPPASQS